MLAGRMVEPAVHLELAAPELDVMGAVRFPGPPRVLCSLLPLLFAGGNGVSLPLPCPRLGRVVEHAFGPVPAPAEFEIVGAVGLPGTLRMDYQLRLLSGSGMP